MNPQYNRQKRYKARLAGRALCIDCQDPNDTKQLRCSDCKRRTYVRQRIKQVVRSMAYYRTELKLLLKEERAWRTAQKRKHAKKPSLQIDLAWRRTGRGAGPRAANGHWSEAVSP